MRSLVRVGWMVAALAASVPVGVRAQGPIDMAAGEMSDDRAKAHFNVGKTLYDAGRFREAAEEWEKAYALSNKSELLYNIYVAHRDASDQPHAIDALKRYLATDVVSPEERINLEARLDAMEKAQAEAAAQESQAAAPAPAPQPASEPAPDPAPEVETSSSLLPYVLMGVGGALVVGGIATGVIANGKVSDIEKSCPDDRCPSGFDLGSARDDARTMVTVTDVLLIGGIVVGGVGVVLAIVGGGDEHAGGTTPQFACGPRGCMAGASGRF